MGSRIYLSASEAGERYGISKWTFYRWALERKLPSYKIGKLRRYALADLDKFFEQFKGNPVDSF